MITTRQLTIAEIDRDYKSDDGNGNVHKFSDGDFSQNNLRHDARVENGEVVLDGHAMQLSQNARTALIHALSEANGVDATVLSAVRVEDGVVIEGAFMATTEENADSVFSRQQEFQQTTRHQVGHTLSA